tara:strand:- start:59 stop:994 length:936 start_codon:yes stop_codon:yes gene_type:complete
MNKKKTPAEKAFEKKKAEKLEELDNQNKKEVKNEGTPLRPEMMQTINVDIEKLRNYHVFIATPCYGGQIGEPYLKAMTQLSILFKHHNLNFTLATIANESLVTRGRNTLVAMFLENPMYTHLMFIDADIGFNPNDIVKLLHRDKEVVTGAYPKKSINWPAIHQMAGTYEADKSWDLAKHQAQYVINVKKQHREQEEIPIIEGLIPVLDSGTGFMMIKRSCIDKLIEKFPETKYNNDLNTDPKYNPYFYAIFDTMIDPESKRYLSEDYTFCRRWQSIGGEIWMDPSIDLDHYGNYSFQGNISEQFTLIKKDK